MTTETSQPTCTICGRLRGYGPPCCDWNLHIGTMSNEVEHWRLGYERENLRANEEHAVRMQLEAAHATLMREALARAEAAESASFDAEERTEEYRRLVETRDEAIAALDAGIGKDVEGVRLAAALAQEKDAREAAEKQRDAAIAHAFVAVGAARAEERRRALVDARDAVRKAVEPGPYRYTAVLAIESLASAPAPLQSPPEQDASHVEAGASRGETSIRIHRASRGSGTSMNDDPKGLMAEQRERLGPLCTHFRYASRCEECGAPPMKAQTDPPPDKPAAGRSADSAATARDALPGGREAVLREVVALFERDYERVSKLAREWATHDTSDGWGATSQSYQAEQGRAAWAAETVRKLLTVQPPFAAALPALPATATQQGKDPE